MRELFWVGSSLDDVSDFPVGVKREIGHGLRQVQSGVKPDNAKIMKGFGGAGVQEIVSNDDGSTFRAVYTVALKHGVYVLHCFQKKSVKGIKTPQPDMNAINARLQRAKELDAEMDR
ncbi:MAG TPA: type II toxin-antitoxin system RelE/ParE family toxin [Dongiaceae bacterium]|nr:type II toxin-antitoxin system RelE/ParE family toxin [Dongiaceae bacterium]